MRIYESTHHLLWPRKDYRRPHDKRLRNALTVGTMWAEHAELHARETAPPHPDIGIVLHLLDRMDERQPDRVDLPLYAIDWLIKQGSQEALDLSDHLVRQLGHISTPPDHGFLK